MLLTKLLKKKLLVMPLIKLPIRLKKEKRNLKKMPPPLRPTVTRLPLMPRLLVIRLLTPLMPLENKPKKPPRVLKKKPIKLKKLPIKLKTVLPRLKVMLKPPQSNSEPHQKNEKIESEMKNTFDL